MISSYQAKSPVLLISFNRPDIALQVFNRVRAVKPPRLYIAVDGPRNNHATDIELIEKTKQIYNQIDWDCKVFKRFRTLNMGCKYAVSDSISWFFQNEEEGIILEDDTLPVDDFFRFCDELLSYYRNDSRIGNITGTNLQFGKNGVMPPTIFHNTVISGAGPDGAGYGRNMMLNLAVLMNQKFIGD